jgi:hypothetical protein
MHSVSGEGETPFVNISDFGIDQHSSILASSCQHPACLAKDPLRKSLQNKGERLAFIFPL